MALYLNGVLLVSSAPMTACRECIDLTTSLASSFGRGRDFSKPKDIAAEFEYIEGKLSQFVTKERLEEAKEELIERIDRVETSTILQIEEVKKDVRGVKEYVRNVKEDVRKLKADVAILIQQISRNETASNIRYFDLRQEVIQQGRSLDSRITQHGQRLDRLDNTVADMNVKLDWIVQHLASSLNVPPPPSPEPTRPPAGPSLAPLDTSFLNEPPTPSPRTPLSPRSLLPRSLSKSKSLTALSSIFRGKGKRKDDGA